MNQSQVIGELVAAALVAIMIIRFAKQIAIVLIGFLLVLCGVGALTLIHLAEQLTSR